jgi:GAF domain-containing protein
LTWRAISGRPYLEGFSAEDLLIAQTLATQAGVLLRNSQIYKTALEDERIGPRFYCWPRHPTHFEPSFLEFIGIY